MFQREHEASGIVQERKLSRVISEPFKGNIETGKDMFSNYPGKRIISDKILIIRIKYMD